MSTSRGRGNYKTKGTQLVFKVGETDQLTIEKGANASAISLTLPVSSDTLIGRITSDVGANRLQNKHLSDDNVYIVDPNDTTKKIRFDAGIISTGTTRTLTMGNGDSVIGGTTNPLDILTRESTQTGITNKTFTAPKITAGSTIDTSAAGTLTIGGTTATTITIGRTNQSVIIGGDLEILQDLAVNGGDITTNQSSFNLINTTATTVNLAGAATSFTMGATTGTTTIRNANTVVSGDLAVNGGDLTTAVTGTFNLLNTNATTINFAGAATTISIGASPTSINISGTVTATTFIGALSGNASTATALATAREINGVDFDGTEDIDITAPTPNALTAGDGLTATTSGGTFDGSVAKTFTVDSTVVRTSGIQTIDGVKTFTETITGSVSGSAGSTNNLTGGVAGSLPYQSAASTTAFLGIGTSNYVLKSTGSAPSWGLIDNDSVSPAAAIAGTKIAPNFGSQNIVTTGSLGIGTTNPGVALHVNASVPVIRMQDSDGTNQFTNIYHSASAFVIDSRNGTSTGPIVFRGADATTTTEYARFASNGNFGIGIASPSQKLDVAGSIQTSGSILTPRLTIDDYSGGDIAGLIPGTTFGGVLVGGPSGHLVMALRENDTNDSFSIISGGGNYSADDTYDTVILHAKANGLVGIGTTSPSSPLHVNVGAVVLPSISSTTVGVVSRGGSTTANCGFSIVAGNAGESSLNFSDTDSESVARIHYDHSTNLFSFRTADGNRMWLNSDGLGIGTSSPSNRLSVDGDADVTGRLGIGTTSPQEELHIQASTPTIRLQDSDGTNQFTSIFHSGTALSIDVRNDTGNGSILFRGVNGTTSTEYARFDRGTGNFGINDTTPSEKLDVLGNIRAQGQMVIHRTVPSDFWGVGENNALHLPYGTMGSAGAYNVSITANGYRNTSGQWTSLGIQGSTAAAQIDLDTQTGDIDFRVATDHPTGSASSVPSKMILKGNGNLGIGVTPPDPPPPQTIEERLAKLEKCVYKAHPECL